MAANDRCRLLNLPAEIRNLIYQHALAPTGYLALVSTRSKRSATNPILATALLATCRQINKEAAQILYDENTVYMTVDAEDTCWPTIAERRLPQHSLEKLQHLFVILDCTRQYFNASFADVDWTPFSALTSLKSLRMVILHHRDGYRFMSMFRTESVQELLMQIMERVPANSEVSFGVTRDSSEEGYLWDVLNRYQQYVPPCTIVRIEEAELRCIAEDMTDVERGCKSGTVVDVFAEHHEQYQRTKVMP